MSITPEHARTLAAVLDGGSFDAAAATLHVTPSAISQRIRSLENLLGTPALRRSRPVSATEAGEAVLRYARQLELLAAGLEAELAPDGHRSGRVALVINADSLHTWALPALATVADQVELEILREDQDHSVEALRSGAVAAAVTGSAVAVPGCRVSRLGVMRYHPRCTPDFAARWFPDGVTAASLAAAPMVVYDRRDDLQDRFLRRYRRAGLRPPRHYVPATGEYAEAVRLGMGWGMIMELQATEADRHRLVPLVEGARMDVTLYWQQWKLSSPGLDAVAAAIAEGARRLR